MRLSHSLIILDLTFNRKCFLMPAGVEILLLPFALPTAKPSLALIFLSFQQLQSLTTTSELRRPGCTSDRYAGNSNSLQAGYDA